MKKVFEKGFYKIHLISESLAIKNLILTDKITEEEIVCNFYISKDDNNILKFQTGLDYHYNLRNYYDEIINEYLEILKKQTE